MEIQEYPSNSHKSREKDIPKRERPAKEGEEELVIREQPLGKKIFKTFIQEDLKDVADTIIHEYIIPGIKESIRAAIDIALGGDGYVGRGSGYSNKSHNSYDKYYGRSERERYKEDRRRDERDGRVRLEDIVYRTRGQAEDVRRDLVADMERYDELSVANFFDILKDNGFKISDRYRDYTDNAYGWYDLGPLRIDPVRGGYIMKLPKPVSIDNND